MIYKTMKLKEQTHQLLKMKASEYGVTMVKYLEYIIKKDIKK